MLIKHETLFRVVISVGDGQLILSGVLPVHGHCRLPDAATIALAAANVCNGSLEHTQTILYLHLLNYIYFSYYIKFRSLHFRAVKLTCL